MFGFLACSADDGKAQQNPRPAYLPNPAAEDWSFLKDPSQKTDFWDHLKYISLGAENRFLTLSGEIRFRPEGFRIRAIGDRPSLRDTYLLQRYLFGADLHLGPRVRFFGEVQSGIISGRLNAPRPTDKNAIDLHQAFFELRTGISGGRTFSLKAGRQELTIGSSRLISASPGLNVKRSFDGVTASYRSSSWRWDAAVARLVGISSGAFDDVPDHQQSFWGFAAARKSPRFRQGELAFYYLGIDRARAVYAQGTDRDQRHTVGAKWAGVGPRFSLNYDAIFQWGTFGGSSIRAWAVSAETAYRFPSSRLRPRFSLQADLASGDRDPADPALQSFNPLFPGSSFAGIIGLLGPTNLSDLTPGVTLVPYRTLILGIECPNYWRTSTGDGVYGVDLRLLIPPTAGGGHYTGSNPGIFVSWQATRHFRLDGVISRFLTGPFLKNTFVANGFGFYSISATYRF